MDYGHGLYKSGQVKALVYGGVSPSHHDDILVAEKGPIADGAVRDPPAGELLLTGHAQLVDLRPTGYEHCLGHEGPLVGVDDTVRTVQLNAGGITIAQLHSEVLSVLKHLLDEVGARNSPEAGVILHVFSER